MKKYFLDTGYLLALELANDKYHQIAQNHWQHIRDPLPSMVTTSYVLDEVVTFFNSRGFHEKAVSLGNMLLYSPAIRLIHVDETLFFKGWDFFRKHRDKNYSLTDCISFVTMKNNKISHALCFDDHFKQAGFLVEP